MFRFILLKGLLNFHDFAPELFFIVTCTPNSISYNYIIHSPFRFDF